MTDTLEAPPAAVPPCIVSRKEWGAVPARKSGIDEVTYPIEVVGISYYTETPSCEQKEDCKKIVREIQQKHIASGSPDIHFKGGYSKEVNMVNVCYCSSNCLSIYNDLSKCQIICVSDGTVYEGQGWKYKPFRAWEDMDIRDKGLDIAYIGDWRKTNIPVVMFSSLVDLLLYGRTKDMVSDKYVYKGFVEKVKI